MYYTMYMLPDWVVCRHIVYGTVCIAVSRQFCCSYIIFACGGVSPCSDRKVSFINVAFYKVTSMY